MSKKPLSYDDNLEEVLSTTRSDAVLEASLVSPVKGQAGSSDKIKKLSSAFSGGSKGGGTKSSPSSEERAREIAELLSYKRKPAKSLGAEQDEGGGRVGVGAAMSPGRRSELEALQRGAAVREKRRLVEDRVEQVEESNMREGEIRSLLEQRRRLSEERSEMARKIKAAGQPWGFAGNVASLASSEDSVQVRLRARSEATRLERLPLFLTRSNTTSSLGFGVLEHQRGQRRSGQPRLGL